MRLFDSCIHQVLGHYTREKVRSLLLIHFPTIFAHLAVSSDSARVLARCLDFVKSYTAVDFADMVKANRQRLLVELLAFYSEHKTRVTLALGQCALNDDNFKKPSKEDKNGLPAEEVAKYVGQSLMASLHDFNVRLKKKGVEREERLQLLKSLNDLILFLGHKNLVERKHAVLETIKMAGTLMEEDRELEEVCITLWHSFVHTMAPAALSDLLPQVLVGLLPHLATCPARAAAIYTFLLVEQAHEFGEAADAPFLMLLTGKEAPGMEAIVEVVRGRGLQFADQLRRLLTFLDHESLEVRRQTLRTVGGLLDSSVASLHTLILRSESISPVVTCLVQALMLGMSCREPDPALRLLAALCLGKVGAVDPGRLEFREDGEGEDEEAILDLFSVGFCSSLLQELVRAQASSGDSLLADVFSYSVQEVLKVYEISASPALVSTSRSSNTVVTTVQHSSFTARVWQRLRESTREVLVPLKDSKFEYDSCQREDIPAPVYLSQMVHLHLHLHPDFIMQLFFILEVFISNIFENFSNQTDLKTFQIKQI